jgi:outer membrane protein assembly factor BamB
VPIQATADRWFDFACDAHAKVGIRAGNESELEVLDLAKGLPTHRLVTNFTSSGRLAVSATGERCLTGGWGNSNGGGVCCYSISDGKELWRRRDLKRPQALRRDDRRDGWIVSLDRGGTHLLDGRSGITQGIIRGAGFGSQVRYVDGRDAYLCIRGNRAELLNAQDLGVVCPLQVPVLWHHMEADARVPSGFSVAHVSLKRDGEICERSRIVGAIRAAIGVGKVVVSVGCGPLLCFSLATGELEWSVESIRGSHYLNVGVCCERRTCYGLSWSRLHGGSEEVVAIDLDTGTIHRREIVPGRGWSSGAFCHGGNVVMSGSGELNLVTLQVRAFA